jgi:hypothetical protein
MTEIRTATPELIDLAAGMRPDWDQRDLTGALAAAAGNGWPFPRTCLAAVRYMCDPKATPRDLRAEVTKPTARKPESPADPKASPEAAAMLADAHARIAERKSGVPQ